jgi:phosphatidylethanolamine-binding protein (PEBP) family uncharacterized protein
MRRAQAATPAAILAALALTGCASTTNTTATSPTIANAVKVSLKSPAVHNRQLPALYTCDGKNINPPIEWGPIPGDTGELVLAAIALTPIAHTNNLKATIEWAISGIKPSQHKLNAGETPPGAHIGLANNNTRHYNLCPKPGTPEQYQFMLYGVPADAKVNPQFADQPIIATLSKPNTPTSATAEGAFLTHYTHKHES